MLVLDEAAVRAAAPLGALIDRLELAFAERAVVPDRHIVEVPGGAGDRVFAAMPAFDMSGAGMVKILTSFPDNRPSAAPRVQGVVIVLSDCGTPIAVLDGTTLTHLRTGAASALASRFLSRPDSAHLVIIGDGAIAPTLASAHCRVRPIRKITVCGRTVDRAARTVADISRLNPGLEVVLAGDVAQAVSEADIVSCATNSATPVLHGRWLRKGAFVDLIGSSSPIRREADDDVVLMSRIFVDTFAGAMTEAGDILDPLRRGIIQSDRIEGELSDLVQRRVAARNDDQEIIMFKSVGAAIEDFAAARLILDAQRPA